jgi:hypothetical protein
MATISGGQPGVAAGGTSSFGQFRLTTFVDSNPKASSANATSPVARPASSGTSTVQSSSNADHSSVALSNSHLQSTKPSQPSMNASPQTGSAVTLSTSQPTATSNQSTDSSRAAHNGFGVLDLAPPIVVVKEGGKLSQHRDGRVRNPVPRKLKGKTDTRNGNFAVMHMDMSGSNIEQLPRGEAARVTSENTLKAAVAAQQAGYTSFKRRRVDGISWPQPPATQASPTSQVPPVTTSVAAVPQPARALAPVPDSQQEPVHRIEMMTPAETKYEQARLLTLLRSISPLTVVDQICKALAFFGGIPGAPPPDDGVFPDSADANGSGALFIGWLSEIFPELGRKSWASGTPKARESDRGKRPRGRPKGSKATKVRKDKGIRKGPKESGKDEPRGLAPPSLPRLRPAGNEADDDDDDGEGDGDDDWVDIGEPDGNAEKAVTPATSRNAVSQRFAPVNQTPVVTSTVDLDMEDLQSPDGQLHSEMANASASKRRPGRPRGSRNRPKEKDAQGNEVPAVEVFSLNQNQRPAQPPPTTQVAVSYFTNTQIAESTPKNKGGRPPGSKNRPKQANEPVVVTAISKIPSNPSASGNKRRLEQSKDKPQSNPLDDLSPEERAILEAFRKEKSTNTTGQPTPSQPSLDKPAEKRKRARKSDTSSSKTNNATPPVPTATATTSAAINSAPSVTDNQNADSLQAVLSKGPSKSSSAILPPPKRPRKPKEPSSAATKKTSSQEIPTPKSTPTPTPVTRPPSVPSTVFSSAPMASEQVIQTTRPPAQGLEAHYERFANLQNENLQSRQDNTNTISNTITNTLSRASPLQSNNFYQQPHQQPRHIPSPYAQYSSVQSNRPYHTSSTVQGDSYRTTNHHQQQQQTQHNAFSPRQQQQHQASQQSPYSHFTDSSFIDLPALESVSNGASNVGYGQGLSRSSSQGNYGTRNSGMGNDFGTLTDNDLREQLLRGIGRR